jgi:hypothetical protein
MDSLSTLGFASSGGHAVKARSNRATAVGVAEHGNSAVLITVAPGGPRRADGRCAGTIASTCLAKRRKRSVSRTSILSCRRWAERWTALAGETEACGRGGACGDVGAVVSDRHDFTPAVNRRTSLLDFELSAEGMDAIVRLDTKTRSLFDHRDPVMVKRLGEAKGLT